MVSDVLFEAEEKLKYYLQVPTYRAVYSGEIRDDIISILVKMESLRKKLDTPPEIPTTT